MNSTTRRILLHYGGALLLTALAAGLRLLLDPLLGNRFPFGTLFVAVAFIAWYGGRGPASLSLLGGLLAFAYLFVAPRYTFAIDQIEDKTGLVLFCLSGIACI